MQNPYKQREARRQSRAVYWSQALSKGRKSRFVTPNNLYAVEKYLDENSAKVYFVCRGLGYSHNKAMVTIEDLEWFLKYRPEIKKNIYTYTRWMFVDNDCHPAASYNR